MIVEKNLSLGRSIYNFTDLFLLPIIDTGTVGTRGSGNIQMGNTCT